jgi:hypothetical protein
VALVGKRVAARVAQHVRMNAEIKLRLKAQSGDHLGKARTAEGRTAFRHEHEWRLAFQRPQRPHFIALQRMHAWQAVLNAPDMQTCVAA